MSVLICFSCNRKAGVYESTKDTTITLTGYDQKDTIDFGLPVVPLYGPRKPMTQVIINGRAVSYDLMLLPDDPDPDPDQFARLEGRPYRIIIEGVTLENWDVSDFRFFARKN